MNGVGAPRELLIRQALDAMLLGQRCHAALIGLQAHATLFPTNIKTVSATIAAATMTESAIPANRDFISLLLPLLNNGLQTRLQALLPKTRFCRIMLPLDGGEFPHSRPSA